MAELDAHVHQVELAQEMGVDLLAGDTDKIEGGQRQRRGDMRSCDIHPNHSLAQMESQKELQGVGPFMCHPELRGSVAMG